jgi:hypothetical protein
VLTIEEYRAIIYRGWLMLDSGDWEESDHPRDKRGRFGKGTGKISAMKSNEMPEPTSAKLPLLPEGRDERFYLDTFMAEFGAKWNETVELTDLVPYRRIVSKDIFTNHLTGNLKINKNGREIYAKYIAETIKKPDEVWIGAGGHGDRTLSFISRFATKKGTLHIITAFKEDGESDVWIGWSGFQSFVPAYYQSKRKGEQIYRRP